MAEITNNISNMINGVSQQPDALRLPSQCTELINGYPHVVDGLSKAPATVMVKKISDTSFGNMFRHTINRDRQERYKVVILNGDLKVFSLDGTEHVVNFPEGKSYLNSLSPRESMAALTLADYTFVVNKNTKVSMAADKSDALESSALIFVKATGYGVSYRVTINDKLVANFTLSTSVVTDLDSSLTAQKIVNNFNVSFEAEEEEDDWEIQTHGPVVYLKRVDGQPFTISVDDSQAGNYLKLVKGRVKHISDLPVVGVRDFVVEVVGDELVGDADNHFVKFVPNEDSLDFAEGLWEETIAPNTEYKFDVATMPHALIREANGTFTFKTVEWGDRVVGTTKSNKDPSFVGQTINDIFFLRDRLSFISGENMICSRTGEFFDFFRSTVMVTVDNDPIDKPASDKKVVTLRYAVPLNETIVLFSDQAQFIVEIPEVFSNKTVKINPMTRFLSSIVARPAETGKTVLFAVDAGPFVAVNEFFVQTDTYVTDTAFVSGHVPRYIPSGVYSMSASPVENVLFILTEKAEHEIYVYKYYWNNNEKVQSSWGKLQYPENVRVLSADFVDSSAYLIVEYPDGMYLERMDIAIGQTDEGALFSYRLRRKVTEQQCGVTFDPESNTTEITAPYTFVSEPLIVTRPNSVDEGLHKEGVILNPLRIVDNKTFVMNGDYSDYAFYVGETYEFKYVFSRLMHRTRMKDGSFSSVTTGRVQATRMTIAYADSGFFQAHVKHESKADRIKTFVARKLGTTSSILGDIALADGSFAVRLGGRNDRLSVEITSDSYLPVKLLSADWKGTYSKNGRFT